MTNIVFVWYMSITVTQLLMDESIRLKKASRISCHEIHSFIWLYTLKINHTPVHNFGSPVSDQSELSRNYHRNHF